jgi:hypothetical protein
MIDKLRKVLKDAAAKVVEVLETSPPSEEEVHDPLLDGEHDEVDDVRLPSWQTEIIEHPQYWVETNYTEAQPDTPRIKATDVMRSVHREAVMIMFNTLRLQLKHAVRPEDGEWEGWVRDGLLHVELKMKSGSTMPRVETAIGAAADTIRTHGVQFEGFPVKVNAATHQVDIDLPVGNVELAIEAPLVWAILQRNRSKPILWQGKIWIPK